MFQGCILVYKSPHLKAYVGHSITASSLETCFPQNSQSMLAHIQLMISMTIKTLLIETLWIIIKIKKGPSFVSESNFWGKHF